MKMRYTCEFGKNVPKGEMYNLTFTWSPNPNLFSFNVFDQYELTRPILLDLVGCCKFKMYSEVTRKGNLHYHGILHVFDKDYLDTKALPAIMKYGYVDLKCEPDSGWFKYIQKDYDKMKYIIPGCLNPFTESDLLSEYQQKISDLTELSDFREEL